MSTQAEPLVTPLICGKCKLPLALSQVTATYLGSEFPIELWKCPSCGKIFVPEELAIGKMLRVEQTLEDK
jgi:RNase P subunit RPR2